MTIWIGEGAPRFWLRSHLALLSSSLPKIQTPYGRGRIRHIFLAEGAIGFSGCTSEFVTGHGVSAWSE